MLVNYKTTLIDKKHLVNNIYLFTFKLIEPQEINFIPGQYLILRVQGKPRLYSIFSSNKIKNQIQFLIDIIPGGLASTYFFNLKIGEQTEFIGPVGQFNLRENQKQKIFLATGTGIAPIISILTSYQLSSDNYFLFWGLKNYQSVYLLDKLKQFNIKICLSQEKDLSVISVNDRQYFDLGHIDKVMEKIFDYKFLTLNSEFYLCGGRSVVESLRENLLSKGVLPENIVLEKF